MKKTILAATVLAFATSSAVFAESQGGNNFSIETGNGGAGEVQFKGEVTSASCTITVGGQSNNAVIRLSPINSLEISTAGAKYKKTDFNIVLSDCNISEDQNTVAVAWTEADLSDNAKGYLANKATGEDAAEGVSLVISDESDKIMIPGTHAETQQGSTEHYATENSIARASYDKSSKSATIPFSVAYITDNPQSVKAGKVESSAVYSVFYE